MTRWCLVEESSLRIETLTHAAEDGVLHSDAGTSRPTSLWEVMMEQHMLLLYVLFA